MKTNISIPADLYRNIYNEIMNYGFQPEDEDDTHCYMEFEIGNFYVSLRATFETCIEDSSFDHAFGTEVIIDVVAGELEDIDEVNIYYDDDTLEEEVDLTEQFSYETFWNQFKRYGTKSKGIDIHYGDEVIVRGDMNYGAWTKMVYLYTDTRLGVHVCAKNLHGKYMWKKYEHILPATTGALAIVGRSNYYLHMKA